MLMIHSVDKGLPICWFWSCLPNANFLKVDLFDSNITITWTHIFEWDMDKDGLKNIHDEDTPNKGLRHVINSIYNYSRCNSQRNRMNLDDHFTENLHFDDEQDIHELQTQYETTSTIWFANHLNLNVCFTSYSK
jgi:hypothetical protein